MRHRSNSRHVTFAFRFKSLKASLCIRNETCTLKNRENREEFSVEDQVKFWWVYIGSELNTVTLMGHYINRVWYTHTKKPHVLILIMWITCDDMFSHVSRCCHIEWIFVHMWLSDDTEVQCSWLWYHVLRIVEQSIKLYVVADEQIY